MLTVVIEKKNIGISIKDITEETLLFVYTKVHNEEKLIGTIVGHPDLSNSEKTLWNVKCGKKTLTSSYTNLTELFQNLIDFKIRTVDGQLIGDKKDTVLLETLSSETILSVYDNNTLIGFITYFREWVCMAGNKEIDISFKGRSDLVNNLIKKGYTIKTPKMKELT